MLGKLKQIYRYIPSVISLPLLKITGGSPIFSKSHWKKIYQLKSKIDNVDLSGNLSHLASQTKQVKFYTGIEYYEFQQVPTVENFEKLPIIDSIIVRENLGGIINQSIPGYYATTGGSGRNPLKVYLSNKSYFRDRTHVFYAWSTLGYSRGDLKLTLRGVNLGNELFRFNPMNNEILLNVFMLNQENIPRILKIINQYKPLFGHGYPSAWYNFALLLKNDNQIFENSLKGIFFASESIDSVKRDFVESVFGKPVRGTYGFTERAGFAYELPEKKNYYKVPHTYGIIEIIKENGRRAKVGERGEIVCTGFLNAGMPLMRYKPGDSAIVGKIENGMVTEIRDIIGRWGKDFILDSKGTEIYTTSINVHTPAQFDFRYIQLVQNKKGYLLIKFVPFTSLNNRSLEAVQREFQEKMPFVIITTKTVALHDLFVTKRGKIPFLVKDISEE